MASIQVRTKGGEYYAFFRDADGRRTSRNTGSHNQREALRIAKKWEGKDRCSKDLPVCQNSSIGTILSSSTWTFSSATRQIWFFLSGDQELNNRPKCLTETAERTTQAVPAGVSGFDQVKVRRLPQLEAAFRKEQNDRALEAATRSIATEIGSPLQLRPKTDEEHIDLLATIWHDFITRKEPCAWGQRWLSEPGKIASERVTDIMVHESVPCFPLARKRSGAVSVIVRLNAEDLASAGAEVLEMESAGSAAAILECRSDREGPLPDDHPRVIDFPFVMIDQIEKRAIWLLRATEAKSENHTAQRVMASEVLQGVQLLRCDAWKLFMKESQSVAASDADWLRFAGNCMWIAGRVEEMDAMLSRSAEVAAATARKLIKGKREGGRKEDPERNGVIEEMAGIHREHPHLSCARVLKRLGITRKPVSDSANPDTDKPKTNKTKSEIYVIPGKGERKLSTLREWWTAARASVKKDSGFPRDPEF